jgi:hypothetical protein
MTRRSPNRKSAGRVTRPVPLVTRDFDPSPNTSLADRLVREPYLGLSSPSARDRFAAKLAESIRLIEYRNRIGRDPGSVDMREPAADDQHWRPFRGALPSARRRSGSIKLDATRAPLLASCADCTPDGANEPET